MARNQVTLAVSGWTQLTNADVTVITIQAINGPVFIRFTTDETTPTEEGGMVLQSGEILLNKTVSDLTKLVSADRVWAKTAGAPACSVYVDHA